MGKQQQIARLQVIVAQGLTNQENDLKQLAPMLKSCKVQAGCLPDEMLLDTGYWSEGNAAMGQELELTIATKKDWKTRKALAECDAPRGRPKNNLTKKELMERKLLTKKRQGSL
ncbi:MAG: hypothetical protein QNL04_06595 [SAR324 cluster bacterium]|nr:hypothetical protein [SAR324 cluster bacterium]